MIVQLHIRMPGRYRISAIYPDLSSNSATNLYIYYDFDYYYWFRDNRGLYWFYNSTSRKRLSGIAVCSIQSGVSAPSELSRNEFRVFSRSSAVWSKGAISKSRIPNRYEWGDFMFRSLRIIPMLTLLLAGSAYSQITIHNNFQPAPGTVLHYRDDSAPDSIFYSLIFLLLKPSVNSME